MGELWAWLQLALALLLALSFGVVFFGAPFVPTKRKDIERALALAELKPGNLIIDLGSGDGRVLLAAAAKGYRGLGYELSPIFAWISRLRLGSYRDTTSVSTANFWRATLPSDTACVFVFLAGPFMSRLGRYIQLQADTLGRPLTLISYGFALPGYDIDRAEGPLKRYIIKPAST